MIAKKIRVFIAHSKSDSDALLELIKARVTEVLTNAAISRGVKVEIVCVLGRDDYKENFNRCGSWDAWAWDVVDRVDYVTRDSAYDAIVVTNEVVGAGTARIVERAFSVKRSIMLFGDDGTLRPIRSIERVSSDFRAGWKVIAS